MAMASVARAARKRPGRMREAIGEVRASRGRAEGRGLAFNLFPEIARIFPGVFADIIAETTIDIAEKSQARAPVDVNPRPGDPESGTLKLSMSYGFRWGAKGVTSGIVEYKAIDPTKREPRHNFARAVESGGVHSPAQPFLVPTIVEERPIFVAKLMNLEDALDAGATGR